MSDALFMFNDRIRDLEDRVKELEQGPKVWVDGQEREPCDVVQDIFRHLGIEYRLVEKEPKDARATKQAKAKA